MILIQLTILFSYDDDGDPAVWCYIMAFINIKRSHANRLCRALFLSLAGRVGRPFPTRSDYIELFSASINFVAACTVSLCTDKSTLLAFL